MNRKLFRFPLCLAIAIGLTACDSNSTFSAEEIWAEMEPQYLKVNEFFLGGLNIDENQIIEIDGYQYAKTVSNEYQSLADIQEEVYQVYTEDYGYDRFFDGDPSVPMYQEQDGILYMRLADAPFPYNLQPETARITEQDGDIVTLEMEAKVPGGMAVVAFSVVNTENGWRIDDFYVVE